MSNFADGFIVGLGSFFVAAIGWGAMAFFYPDSPGWARFFLFIVMVGQFDCLMRIRGLER